MPSDTRIDPNQSFSQMAKQLHDQFREVGSGGVRLDGEGLYVKKSKGFVDQYVGTKAQLTIRHNKFQNAIVILSAGLEREHPDVMVGDKTLKDYVFGDLLSENGFHRLDEDMLTLLEDKVKIGLAKSQGKPIDSSELTASMLSIAAREDGSLPVKGSFEDSFGGRFKPALMRFAKGGAQSSSVSGDAGVSDASRQNGRRRDYVEGREMMRQAIANDLENVLPHLGLSKTAGGDLDLAKTSEDIYLDMADDIIAQEGLMTSDLTNAAIDKIRIFLLTTPEYNQPNDEGRYQEFPATRALYGKVETHDSVKVNTDRLTKLVADIESKVAEDVSAGALDRSDGELLRAYLHENKQLIKEINNEKWNILNEKTTSPTEDEHEMGREVEQTLAYDLASKLLANAKAMNKFRVELNVSPELAGLGDISDLSPGKSYPVKGIPMMELLENMANATHDFARSLLPVEDRASLKLDAAVPLFVVNDSSTLQQDWAISALRPQSILSHQLDCNTVVYQDPDFVAREARSSLGHPVVAYNANIAKFRAAYHNYLFEPKPDTLAAVRENLDEALASSHHLRAHLEKVERIGPSRQRDYSMSNNAVLEAQVRELEKFSFAVEVDRVRMYMQSEEPDHALFPAGDNMGLPELDDSASGGVSAAGGFLHAMPEEEQSPVDRSAPDEREEDVWEASLNQIDRNNGLYRADRPEAGSVGGGAPFNNFWLGDEEDEDDLPDPERLSDRAGSVDFDFDDDDFDVVQGLTPTPGRSSGPDPDRDVVTSKKQSE